MYNKLYFILAITLLSVAWNSVRKVNTSADAIIAKNAGKEDDRVLFGAIRWDYWNEATMRTSKPTPDRAGTAHENMESKEWSDRLPLYAKVLSEDPYEVDLRADTPEAIDLEIGYAREAGLDYWAFLYYPSDPDMSRCRELYLKSTRKEDVNFCLIVSRWGPEREKTRWEDNIAEIVTQVKYPTYQCVDGGRPLIYLFLWDNKRTPELIWGSIPEAKRAVGQLRKAVIDAGFKDPFLVAMAIRVNEGANYMETLALDGIAAYTTFGGTTYDGLAKSNVAWWEQSKTRKANLILPVNCGWGGPRPSGKDNKQPTPQEFKEHLQSAVTWEREHPELTTTNSILIYAWNEFDEGGFLCPTRGEKEGQRKIDQLRQVVDDQEKSRKIGPLFGTSEDDKTKRQALTHNTQSTVSPNAKMSGVEVHEVKWTEGFWAEKVDLCKRATLPSVEAALLDDHNGAQLINFKIAAGLGQGKNRGTDWSDGDCYKWIEAMAFMFALTGDNELDRKMDYWIGVIAKAQAPDGYISTNIQLDPNKKRWEDVQHHALYNMGHLITAACSHKRATGKDSFLNVAQKVADYLYKVFASRPTELARMDFNPSHMMALVDLYRVTGNRKYLELADIFVTMRGSAPATTEQGRDKNHMGGTDQTQDRVPLRKEDQAVGHAVTGTYLWCGAADLYMETGDSALLTALDRIWKSATLRTYITGGIGSGRIGKSTRGDEVHEAFGSDHELPNRTAYNETCANIGNAMWNWRMLQITGEAKYGDLLETVLYNSMLSSVSTDGKNFFYANPLAWDGRIGWPHQHYTETRWSRLGCYCCPPQVARTIAGLGRWAYSVSSDAVWVHLYSGNKLQTKLPDGSPIALTQQSNYPWDGNVKITITQAPAKPCALKLRIPAWAVRATLTVNGEPVAADPGAYTTVQRKWAAGDVVELDLPLAVRIMKAHPAVEDCHNRVAVLRGPVVYCFERPKDQDAISLPENVRLTPRQENGITILTGKNITLIPYFTWANNGPSFMEVWIPLENKNSQ